MEGCSKPLLVSLQTRGYMDWAVTLLHKGWLPFSIEVSLLFREICCTPSPPLTCLGSSHNLLFLGFPTNSAPLFISLLQGLQQLQQQVIQVVAGAIT